VLQMNLDGPWLDPQLVRDFLVLKALLDQFQNLLFAGCQFASWITV
jgi:hypothetical protein